MTNNVMCPRKRKEIGNKGLGQLRNAKRQNKRDNAQCPTPA